MKQIDQAERARINALRAAHYAATRKGGEPQGETALEDMKVADLRALAAERGVDLEDATKKADIIAALQLAAEASAD